MKPLLTKIRYIAYVLLGRGDALLGRENNLFVMCYHDISLSQWPHSVKISTFKKHINYLLKSGFTFITPQEFEDYFYKNVALPKKSILLTFDDGCKSVMEIVDFLKAKNITPIAFVLSDVENADTKQIGINEKKLMSIKDVMFLKQNGLIVGCHSATHSDFHTLSDIEEETSKAVKSLAKKLKQDIKYFAYPRGRYTQEIQKQLKTCGIQLAFSMDDGIIDSTTDKYAIPRIAFTGSHSFEEFRYSYSPTVIAMRRIAKKLFNKYL